MPASFSAFLNLLTLATLTYCLCGLVQFFRRDTQAAIKRLSFALGVVGVVTVSTKLFWGLAPSVHAGDVRLMLVCALPILCGIGIGVLRAAHR